MDINAGQAGRLLQLVVIQNKNLSFFTVALHIVFIYQKYYTAPILQSNSEIKRKGQIYYCSKRLTWPSRKKISSCLIHFYEMKPNITPILISIFFFASCAALPPVKPIRIRDGAQGNYAFSAVFWNRNILNLETESHSNENVTLLDLSTYLGYGITSINSMIGLRLYPLYLASQFDFYFNPINVGRYSAGIGTSIGYALFNTYLINGIKLYSIFVGLGFGLNKRFRDSFFQFEDFPKNTLHQTWLQLEYPIREKITLLGALAYSAPFNPGTYYYMPRAHNFPDYPLQLSSVYAVTLTIAIHAYAF